MEVDDPGQLTLTSISMSEACRQTADDQVRYVRPSAVTKARGWSVTAATLPLMGAPSKGAFKAEAILRAKASLLLKVSVCTHFLAVIERICQKDAHEVQTSLFLI
jgi:hypothetical protein